MEVERCGRRLNTRTRRVRSFFQNRFPSQQMQEEAIARLASTINALSATPPEKIGTEQVMTLLGAMKANERPHRNDPLANAGLGTPLERGNAATVLEARARHLRAEAAFAKSPESGSRATRQAVVFERAVAVVLTPIDKGSRKSEVLFKPYKKLVLSASR